MKCYYEELGVAREADDSEIKKAYRKLALRWHPDKNPSCLDEAKERFQAVQQAYEVLSDGHERSWYDNHREQILRGKNSDYEEKSLDLFQYFTVSCFKGYEDDSKGFYAIYREVFEKIAAEDAEFMDDEEELTGIPQFGNSQSNYEEVVSPFYAYWQAYCTKKTYTWLCPYDIQEIKDRRILREIEKDMKKVVQKAKRERNEEVRNLVSFVRKRDKRVQANRRQLEERAALNRQKQENNRLEQIRKRLREVEEMRNNHSNNTFNEGYEEQLKQLEQDYDSDNSSSDGELSSAAESGEADEAEEAYDEEYYLDDLYCVACNKTFKNEKAYANHETSKKHRDNNERIKQQMLEEDEAFKDTEGDEQQSESMDAPAELELSDHSSPVEETSNQTKKNRKTKKSKKANKSNALPLPDSDHDEEENAPILTAEIDNSNDEQEDWNSSVKKGAKRNKSKKQTKKSSEAKTPTETIPKESPLQSAAPPTAALKSVQISDVDDAAGQQTSHICVTCGTTFPSKNKLFSHLKITNHGVHIPKTKTGERLDTQTKKSKGKRK